MVDDITSDEIAAWLRESGIVGYEVVLVRKDQRIAALEAALREARAMLGSCGLDEPDEDVQASWDRGLAKVDAALRGSCAVSEQTD